jgi:hypothetical protein
MSSNNTPRKYDIAIAQIEKIVELLDLKNSVLSELKTCDKSIKYYNKLLKMKEELTELYYHLINTNVSLGG